MALDASVAQSRGLGANPHGVFYYDGYIYVIRRDHSYHGAVLYKINANDYRDIESKIVVGGFWSFGAGLTDIIKEGDYLYISSWQKKLVKVHIPTFTPSLIGLPLASSMSDCLCSDGTFIWIYHTGHSGKITRVTISSEVNSVFNLGASLYWHGVCRDGNNHYVHDQNNGRLYKIQIVGGVPSIVGYAVTGRCADDICQDDTYVFLGREFVTAAIVRVRKSDLDVTVYTPDGYLAPPFGFSYGVIRINDRIMYLDYEHDHIWEFNSALDLIEGWDMNLPAPYAGINELAYDGYDEATGTRFFHATTFTTPGIIRFALGSITHVETGKLQIIQAKQGQIQPQGEGVLALSISNSFVDVLSTKIGLRTINQGHSMFTAILDNISGGYTNQFAVREPVTIIYKDVEIFKGVLDSGKHILSQDDKWNLSDFLRLGGRDWSFDLAGHKYLKTWPVGQQVIDAIVEMLANTDCNITITPAESGLIDDHTSVDKYLLDSVIEMFEVAKLEGYVDMLKDLKYFSMEDPPSVPITFDSSNVLSAAPIEFDGLDIKNHIEILGDKQLEEPEISDVWTDASSLDDPPVGQPGPKWEKIMGTALWIADGGIINKFIKCSTVLEEGAYHAAIRLTLPETIPVGYHGQFTTLDFWMYVPMDLWPDNDCFWVYLGCADGSYFYTLIEFKDWIWPWSGNWLHYALKLGVEETNTPGLPSGMWHPVGNPDWLNIVYVEFYGIWNGDNVDDAIMLDGLKFTPKRTHAIKANYTSIGKYNRREFLEVTDAVTNKECQYMAESYCNKMSVPVSILQIITPLDTFIIDEVWKGLVGYKVEVDLPGVAVGVYRIADITIDITPYTNLKNGYDAIATVNLIPLAATYHPDSYAVTARPRTPSLMKRKENKGVRV